MVKRKILDKVFGRKVKVYTKNEVDILLQRSDSSSSGEVVIEDELEAMQIDYGAGKGETPAEAKVELPNTVGEYVETECKSQTITSEDKTESDTIDMTVNQDSQVKTEDNIDNNPPPVLTTEGQDPIQAIRQHSLFTIPVAPTLSPQSLIDIKQVVKATVKPRYREIKSKPYVAHTLTPGTSIGAAGADDPYLTLQYEHTIPILLKARENYPAEFRHDPTYDTGDILLKPVMYTEQFPGYPSPPNYMFRFESILLHLNSIMTVPNFQIEKDMLLGDLWSFRSRWINQKIKGNLAITPIEIRFYRTYRGFAVQYSIRQAAEMMSTRASLRRLKVPETPQERVPDDAYLPYPCSLCEVSHISPELCQPYDTHSPTVPDLGSISMGMQDAKAIWTGTATTKYLPPQLKKSVLNLYIGTDFTYIVSGTVQAYVPNPQRVNDSLYHKLTDIAEIIGYDNPRPWFIEFFTAYDHLHMNILYHLFAFLKLIKALQRIYLGPIIMVVGGTPYRVFERIEAYEERKEIRSFIFTLARTMGTLFGVPVVCMATQVSGAKVEGQRLIEHHYKDEMLYNSRGLPTRETFNRMATLIQLWIKEAEFYH